jgi:regulator of replication initiation timing
MIAIEKIYTPEELAALGTQVTLQQGEDFRAESIVPRPRIQQLIDQNNALRAENATLRSTLIDATGQRDEYYRQLISRTSAIQQELDNLLQERVG